MQHNLSIVIPVYRGAQSIKSLMDIISALSLSGVNLLEVILVNDDSPDHSHEVILKLIEQYPSLIKYIRLFRNFGEHNAVMCGLNHINGDIVAIIDDDFQNEPTDILALSSHLIENNYDVVYSYYKKKKHSLFRNIGSKFNDYCATKLLQKPKNLYLSSFKVISAPLVKEIIEYKGPYPYIDGLILRTTTKIGTKLCKHNSRSKGESGYTLGKLIGLWLNMSTGYSLKPLRIATISGLFLALFSFLLTAYIIISKLYGPIFSDNPIPIGWASTVTIITFISGIQLLLLGIIGEYIGRILLSINNNPQYVIREMTQTGKDI